MAPGLVLLAVGADVAGHRDDGARRARPENGCLQIVPGSHHEALQHYGGELRVDIDDRLQAQTCYVPLKPGDTLMFHSLLLHASEPNHSNEDRRACICSYKTPSVTFASARSCRSADGV